VSRQRRRHTTVPAAHPPAGAPHPMLPRMPRRPKARRPARVPARQIARIVDRSDASLLDVVDHLLNKGVVLNADLVLALADVNLVYIRLSALLCAADRIMPRDEP
jgi:hypothetical protein